MAEYKIDKVEPVLLVDRLDEPFFFSQFEYTERRICLVRITLSNGLIGWGEGYGPGSLVKAGIEKFAPFLIGKNPLHHENLWQEMYRLSYDYARKGIVLSALSGIDIALWDIKGKILHQPISTLLGGRKREQIKMYATGLYFSHCKNQAEALVEEVLKYKAMGFSAVKMKVGLGIDTDLEHITAVRQAIGADMQLMIDANHAFELREAQKLVDKLKDLDISWFEEPISNEDYEGYAELRRTSSIPIAGGECEYLKYGAQEMLSRRCVDIFQPDTGACGGITEVKNMMAIAQAHHTNLTPHTWGTGIAIATNLHLMSNNDVVPQRLFQAEPIMELDCSPNKLRDELLVDRFTPVDGYLAVPSGNGLGIEIDEQQLAKYSETN
jgi:D-galactarolactone cycloisomerase